MSTLPRQFRGPESHAAEIKSRDAVAPFLMSRGYQVLDDQRIKTGMATQQFIVARAPDGQNLKTRIRLCWRRDGRNSNEQKYSAAQLAAHLRPGGWDATLEHMVERDISQGVTHNLLFQREGEGVAYAALIYTCGGDAPNLDASTGG